MAQLWGGRFTKETDKLVYNFNASISFDKKFYKQDMEGSMAHVRMLAKQGILTEGERDAEGAQTMRNLARNMVWLIACIQAGREKGIGLPNSERGNQTNFNR